MITHQILGYPIFRQTDLFGCFSKLGYPFSPLVSSLKITKNLDSLTWSHFGKPLKGSEIGRNLLGIHPWIVTMGSARWDDFPRGSKVRVARDYLSPPKIVVAGRHLNAGAVIEWWNLFLFQNIVRPGACIPEGTSILPIIQYPVIMTLHDSLIFSFRLISVSLVGTVSGSV